MSKTDAKWMKQAGGTAKKQEIPSGTVNGSNTIFSMTFTPINSASVEVFLNGIPQLQADYTINVGAKTVTFSTAPALGQQPFVAYDIA